MTTFTGCAKRITKGPLAGTDHTWVVTEPEQNCWPALGGGEKGNYYCKSNHWSKGTYTPPSSPHSKGKKVCTGSGEVSQATCMGKPKRTTHLKIPSSAGVVYGINGVCHMIANRVLYHTGKTVSGAKGYWLSCSHYGTYGTLVPPEAYLVSPAAAASVNLTVLIDWKKRKDRCRAAAQNALAGIDTEIQEIHGKAMGGGKVLGSDLLDVHLREMDLLLVRRLGESTVGEKLAGVRQLYRDRWTVPIKKAANVFEHSSWEEKAGAANASFSAFQEELAKILGEESYEKMFEWPAGKPIALIDPEVLAAGAMD
jgi:hypothetical protein